MKILDKMMYDFMCFFVLFILLIITFAVIGNFNFIQLIEFQGVFPSCLTVFNASLGNFDISIFEAINNEGLKLLG